MLAIVLDHHKAELWSFKSKEDEIEKIKTISVDDPHGYHQHLTHKKEADYQGQRTPEDLKYYENIVAASQNEDEIVILGSGTGKSSAMDVFKEFIEKKHHTLSNKIKYVHTDVSALTAGKVKNLALEALA